MRTGKIGLRKFLFDRKVPDIPTPLCRCGTGRDTTLHIAIYCPIEADARCELPFATRTREDYEAAVRKPERAAQLTR